MKQPTSDRIIGIVVSLALHCSAIALLATYSPLTVQRDLPSSQLAEDLPLRVSAFLFDEEARESLQAIFVFEDKDDAVAAITIPETPPALEAVTADSIKEARIAVHAVDLKSAEELQGIYSRQLNARIGRVLAMQGSSVARRGGRCTVHIVQGEGGDVLDVDLFDCERAADELHRLSAAIFAASPLPNPPRGLAVGTYIRLDLSGL